MPKQTKHKQHTISPRLRRKLFQAALVLAAAGIVLALSLTVLFPARSCVVVGNSRYTAEQFEQAMGIHAQRMNVFTADRAALARKAHAALPYAHIESISRRFPGTLRLTVTEIAPAFAQEQDELWWLIAEDGKLLGTAEEPPEGLMLITGMPLTRPAAGQKAEWAGAFTDPESIAELLACLKESSLWPSITALRISTSALPDAIYQNRIRIRFGTASPSAASTTKTVLTEKLRMAVEVIAEKDKQNPKQQGVLDLSTYGKAYFTADWS